MRRHPSVMRNPQTAQASGAARRLDPMKLLVLSMNFAPELTGIGKYSGEMAHGLVDRGHEVMVVCAPPYYPQWQVGAGYDGGSYRSESPRAGLTVVRCPVWMPARPSGSRRLLHLASFALSCGPVTAALAAWRPQVVFAVAPSILTAPVALLAARLCNAASWLHVQDFEIDAAFELGLLEGPRMRRGVLAVERATLRRFDRVTTISAPMLETLLAKGVAPERAGLFPNGVDVSEIRPAGRSPALRLALGVREDQTVCLYAGTMNRKQGLQGVVEAARRLQARDDIVFVLSGDGECKPALEAAAAGLPNVRFQGLCPAERLNDLLNLADIHLLPQLRGAADLVMPSKLTGMLASGRPVIAAADAGTEIARVVAGCGRVVTPECLPSLTRAIVELADDAALRVQLGNGARALAVEHLDRSLLLDRLDARLQQLNRCPPPRSAHADSPVRHIDS